MSGDLHRLPIRESILSPGQIVGGRYCVDALLAEGGMAAVWAGHNQRTGKRVALKVILGSMATDGEAADLFRDEALVASKINHPNVVSIFDVIDHASMTCIVMELLDGETLDVYLARNRPLSLHETVALLLPAMHGVAAAHAQGVIHRDLKPGNIFLCKDADGRLLTSKVLDFGIATVMRRAGDASVVTDLSVRMGTPAYMSPEAIQGLPEIDGRTDVYGFGVLMFEALTGMVPFPGEPGIDLYARIIGDAPPKVTDYRLDLPSEVGRIVGRIVECALAKNAEDRFPDMDHLIGAVEEGLLPASPMPRALTPMQGIVPVQLAEAKRASTSSAVGELINVAPSGRGRHNETRVLFALPGHSRAGVDGANFPRGPGLKQPQLMEIVNQARRLLMYFTGLGLHLRQRTVIGAGLAVVVVAAVWMAVAARAKRPDSGGIESRGTSSPVIVQAPRVLPLAIPPGPAPSPHASVPGPGTARALAGTPVPLSSERVVRKIGLPDRPSTKSARVRSNSPRAGRLSPADF
jgi:hypothetical protein